jgi:hypothetical protein
MGGRSESVLPRLSIGFRSDSTVTGFLCALRHARNDDSLDTAAENRPVRSRAPPQLVDRGDEHLLRIARGLTAVPSAREQGSNPHLSHRSSSASRRCRQNLAASHTARERRITRCFCVSPSMADDARSCPISCRIRAPTLLSAARDASLSSSRQTCSERPLAGPAKNVRRCCVSSLSSCTTFWSELPSSLPANFGSAPGAVLPLCGRSAAIVKAWRGLASVMLIRNETLMVIA